MRKRGRLWITWERQRRSVELAELLDCRLIVIEGTGLGRYPTAFLKTVYALATLRPRVLFAQNPSIFLAVLACAYGALTGTKVVIDRHSNFVEFSKHSAWASSGRGNIRRRIFSALSRFSLRSAHVTIVTNDFVAELVSAGGGSPFVLPDPIPLLKPLHTKHLSDQPVVFVVSSFADDEPVAEMMEAARRLGGEEVTVYFSGNPVRPAVDWRIGAPANVKFTGFLPMHDYVDTIFSADIVVVLTTVDHCLLCGCYEAVAAEKPLITSDTAALRRHFFGAEFVHHDVGSLATGIRRVLANPEHFRAQSKVMRTELTVEWKRQFSELEAAIGDG